MAALALVGKHEEKISMVVLDSFLQNVYLRTVETVALTVVGKHRENKQGHLRYVGRLKILLPCALFGKPRQNKQGFFRHRERLPCHW
jgi:hypothetical protein